MSPRRAGRQCALVQRPRRRRRADREQVLSEKAAAPAGPRLVKTVKAAAHVDGRRARGRGIARRGAARRGRILHRHGRCSGSGAETGATARACAEGVAGASPNLSTKRPPRSRSKSLLSTRSSLRRSRRRGRRGGTACRPLKRSMRMRRRQSASVVSYRLLVLLKGRSRLLRSLPRSTRSPREPPFAF